MLKERAAVFVCCVGGAVKIMVYEREDIYVVGLQGGHLGQDGILESYWREYIYMGGLQGGHLRRAIPRIPKRSTP